MSTYNVYIGRCDLCGRNLYDCDDWIGLTIAFNSLMVCRNCCVVNRGGKKYDITDLLDEIESEGETK